MTNVNKIIAENFYDYRNTHGLSLDKLSYLTGVSKNMLSQIEKGSSNPSIMTLSKIANGLHIPLSQLITYNVENINQIDKKDLIPIYNDEETVTIYPYFPYDSEKDFEMFKMVIESKGWMRSEGHFPNSDEYIIVIEGDLEIEINGVSHTVKKEQAIHFKSNVPHTYRNQNNRKLILIATIQYSN